MFTLSSGFPIEEKLLKLCRELTKDIMVRRLQILFFCALLLFQSNLFAQETSVQSLLSDLEKKTLSTLDSARILTRLSRDLGENSPDSAVFFGDKAILLAKSENQDSILAIAYLATSVGYSMLGKFETSARYNFEAMTIGERLQDTVILIDANNNLGIDFYYREELLEAKKYFERVEVLTSNFGDSSRLGHALNNIGLVLGLLGDTEVEIEYYERSKTIFEQIEQEEGAINAIMNLGTAYLVLNRDEEAINAFESAVRRYDELNVFVGKSQALMNLAEAHLKGGNSSKSIYFSKQAEELAVEHNLRTEQAYAYDHLTKIYSATEDYRNAFNYLKKYQEISKEIYSQEKSTQIKELEARYEAEKREREIDLLKVNNRLIQVELEQKKLEQRYLIGFFVVLVIVGVWIVLQYREKLRLKNSLLTKEIDELRWKINAMVEGVPDGVSITLDQLNKQLQTPLTEREFDILILALSEKSNKQIAEETFVSINTVKYHMKNIYEKLGVSSRGEVLQFVIRSS